MHQGGVGRLHAGDFVEAGKAGVAVGMQPAGEVGQLRTAVLALAIGRIAIKHGRRRGAPVRALVAQVDPQPARLRLAVARRQHVDRRIVCVDDPGSHHVGSHSFDERSE